MKHEAEDSHEWEMAGFTAQVLIKKVRRAPSVASIKSPEVVKFVDDFFAYCRESHLSMAQVARLMSTSLTPLSQIRRGERLPGMRTMLEMSKLSGIPMPRTYAGPFADSGES